MGWDSSRPVPWRRLIREWVIYAAIMSAVFLIFFRGDSTIGAVAGVLISGPLYLAFGAVMAKFGYQRQQLRRPAKADATAGTTAGTASDRSATDSAGPRPKPAPTSRTGGRPASSAKRRR